MNVANSQDEAARIIGVSRRTLCTWLGEGCPGKPGNYDIAAIRKWRIIHKDARADSRPTRSSSCPYPVAYWGPFGGCDSEGDLIVVPSRSEEEYDSETRQLEAMLVEAVTRNVKGASKKDMDAAAAWFSEAVTHWTYGDSGALENMLEGQRFEAEPSLPRTTMREFIDEMK